MSKYFPEENPWTPFFLFPANPLGNLPPPSPLEISFWLHHCCYERTWTKDPVLYSHVHNEGMVDQLQDILLVLDVLHLLESDDVSDGQDLHGEVLVVGLLATEADAPKRTRPWNKITHCYPDIQSRRGVQHATRGLTRGCRRRICTVVQEHYATTLGLETYSLYYVRIQNTKTVHHLRSK